MTYYIIPYETADGDISLVAVNAGTIKVLVQSENKESAQRKQTKRNIDFRNPDKCAAHWFNPPESLEDQYIRKEQREELHNAMSHLTETQMRRIRAHFFDGLTFRQIAEMEKASLSSVRDSIGSALKSLRKFF